MSTDLNNRDFSKVTLSNVNSDAVISFRQYDNASIANKLTSAVSPQSIVSLQYSNNLLQGVLKQPITIGRQGSYDFNTTKSNINLLAFIQKTIIINPLFLSNAFPSIRFSFSVVSKSAVVTLWIAQERHYRLKTQAKYFPVSDEKIVEKYIFDPSLNADEKFFVEVLCDLLKTQCDLESTSNMEELKMILTNSDNNFKPFAI